MVGKVDEKNVSVGENNADWAVAYEEGTVTIRCNGDVTKVTVSKERERELREAAAKALERHRATVGELMYLAHRLGQSEMRIVMMEGWL